MQKRISHGKHTSHYLLLSNWGKEDDHEERDVSENFYDSVQVGDSIEVDVHPGKWGIPWVVLSR